MELDSFERFKNTEAWERFLYGAENELVQVVPTAAAVNSPGRQASSRNLQRAPAWGRGWLTQGWRWLNGDNNDGESISLNRDDL